MAEYNFTGDIENIPKRQLELINNIITKQGFENFKVNFEKVGQVGDNFAANVKRIVIEDEHRNTTLIVKLAPTSEIARTFLFTDGTFVNEHVMYSEVFRKINELQNNAGIPVENQLRFPKYFGSCIEKPNEVIVVEDLKPCNFITLDRMEPLTNIYVKSVLKNLAKLHSMSYVLNRKEPEQYNTYKLKLCDIHECQNKNEKVKFLYKFFGEELLDILDEEEHVEYVKRNFQNTLEEMASVFKADFDSEYSVIGHGDAWTTNFMFRLENDELKESVLIDFQYSKSASPVYDVMFMIFNSTDYETRKKYFYEWLHYYHTELEKFLTNFNLKVTDEYSRSKLDEDLKRYGKAIFGICLILIDMFTRNTDEVAKLMEMMLNDNIAYLDYKLSTTNLGTDTKTRFKIKATELIQSFIDFDLL